MNTIGQSEIHSFIEKYNKALSQNKETFFFKGSEVLVSYAYYVIQYANATLSIGEFDGKQFIINKN
jgi:hypothetical protein